MIKKQVLTPKVAVVQLGARMHYAVPAILHLAGMLDHFYTDSYLGQGSSWHMLTKLSFLLPERFRPAGLKRLLGRREDGLPAGKVIAYNYFGLSYARGLKKARGMAERERIHLDFGRRFCELLLRYDFSETRAIYAFSSVALPLFQKGGSSSTIMILEQPSAPAAIDWQWVAEERSLWPGWEAPYPPRQVWEPRIDLEQQEWKAANAVVCGSEFVALGLAAMGVPLENIRVVPYGVEPSHFAATRTPYDGRRPLRVLFVGGVSLRKGPQYLVQALGELNSTRVVARLVGPVAIRDPYRRRWQTRVEVTGQVSRTEMRRHYEWADVFVFPSICEGSATVTYEALAAGLPVITTAHAGSVVRDGVEGFIVPIRDAGAIAEKMERLAADPELLKKMSCAAEDRAQEFSWEKYGERLVTTMKHLIERS